jgi:hypothetical protein
VEANREERIRELKRKAHSAKVWAWLLLTPAVSILGIGLLALASVISAPADMATGFLGAGIVTVLKDELASLGVTEESPPKDT